MKSIKECLLVLSDKNVDININRTIKYLCENIDNDQLEYLLSNGVNLDGRKINLYFYKNAGFKCDNNFVEQIGHLPVCNLIEKTLNTVYKSADKPKRTEFPYIFQYTLYRIPTKAELMEFEHYPELTPEEILHEISWTLIGKGMLDNRIKNQICDTIQKLIDFYPQDIRYKEAFLLAKGMTGRHVSS